MRTKKVLKMILNYKNEMNKRAVESKTIADIEFFRGWVKGLEYAYTVIINELYRKSEQKQQKNKKNI